MSDFDYSKLSDEELEAIANPKKESMVSSALKGYGNYAKGFAKGGGQALGDIGASIINWPLEGIEKGTGHKIPRVPHPHLLDEEPGSLAESIGRKVGEFAPMVTPLGSGIGAASIIGKGAPFIAKALAGAAGGGLLGAASNEEDRLKGAEIGALLGGLGEFVHASPHMTKHGAAKDLRKAHNIATEKGIREVEVPHELIEDARQFLPNTAPYHKLLEKAHEGHYQDLFNLQSDLRKHAGDYSTSRFSAAERAHGREGLAARQRLVESIQENLRKQGHNEVADLMKSGQENYRRHMKIRPYLNIAKGLGVAGTINSAFPHNPVTETIKHLLLRKSH